MKPLLAFPTACLLLVFCLNAWGTAAPQEVTGSAEIQGVNPDTLPAMGLQDSLPVDPHVRIGRLENGLTYYIRENNEPKDRAQLRLAVNAGSVLEKEDQQGVAHFLEHMLFNGTKRFEKQAIINFMERIGMEFGPDVNAYTSFDETVYKLQVPTDTAQVVERAFDVLEDWAAYATLAGEEIDKERGVVIEEWRQRSQTASGRMLKETLPVYLHDSRYAQRLPIGDTTVIKNISYERVRDFYQHWYRPELMTVVAVGDFNADSIEKTIREHFSDLPTPADPPRRSSFEVPGHDSTLYKVVTDPEYPHLQVEVTFKKDDEPVRTVADYRERLVGQLFNNMLNQRFNEIERKSSSPFLSARVYRGGFVRPSEFYGLEATVQEDSVLTGLEALVTEALRVRRHGFTKGELKRQKADVLRAYRQAFEERKNTRSASYAQEYIGHSMEGEPVPGIAYTYALVQRYLPKITVEKVNQQAAELLADSNRAVIVRMPESDSLEAPTEAELAQVLQQVEQKSIEPYVDDVGDEPLLSNLPAPAEVVEKSRVDTVDVTEITLANGVRVVMKPTTFKEEEVQFTAFSPGGSSLVADADYFDAAHAASIVQRSGVGPFTRTQLEKKLAGQVVSVSPYIGELQEGFRGNAAPEDLETLFKLVYLYATQPRADSSALDAFQNQMRSYLKRRSLSPSAVFQDSLSAAFFGYDIRKMAPTLGMVDTLRLQDVRRIYQNRFADFSDFTFVFAGNFSEDSLQALAQQYLGNLPSTNRTESWQDVVPDPPSGVVSKTVRAGQGQRSQTVLAFHDSFAYNRINRHRIRSLAEVLNIKLREELREDRSAVYSVQAQSSSSGRPDSLYRLFVYYGSSPDSADALVDAVFKQVESLKAQPVEKDYVRRVQEQQRRQRETALETNSFWLNVLQFYYSHEDEHVRDVLAYDELIDSLSPENIQEAARQYLKTDQYIKVILYPENTGVGPRQQAPNN